MDKMDRNFMIGGVLEKSDDSLVITGNEGYDDQIR
jgi:hypothetical protein